MQKATRTWQLAGAALAAAALLTASIAVQAQDERDYYKVGVITALSGDFLFGGNVTKRGYELWEEQVNDRGGIEVNGEQYKVELVYADAQSDPKSSAEAVQRMITHEDVDFILGPYSSATTLGAAPIVERYKIPMITGSAESPSIWQRQFAYTFGAVPAADLLAGSILSVMADQHPEIETVAVIGMNDPFSKSTAEALRNGAEEAGLEVLFYDIVPQKSDITPQVSKAQSMDPDVLALGGEPLKVIDLVKAMQQLDYQPKGLVIHYGINTPDFLEAVGEAANHVVGATVWDPTLPYEDDLFGTGEDYVKLSEQRYDVTPDYTQAASSATGRVYEAALQKAGLTPPLSDEDKTELRDTLETV